MASRQELESMLSAEKERNKELTQLLEAARKDLQRCSEDRIALRNETQILQKSEKNSQDALHDQRNYSRWMIGLLLGACVTLAGLVYKKSGQAEVGAIDSRVSPRGSQVDDAGMKQHSQVSPADVKELVQRVSEQNVDRYGRKKETNVPNDYEILTLEGLRETQGREYMIYTCHEGDTFESIAVRYFGRRSAADRLNKCNEGIKTLFSGLEILIPTTRE